MRDTLEELKKMVKSATLNDVFIPNKLAHLGIWAENVKTDTKNAFTSNIDEGTISSIMLLKDVEDSWKILLLLGIGVFTEHKSIAYTEIMKKLADKQLLYLIIADTDYIYGTNYQFCHGYLSKDLNMTQEKIIQALGRIGRNNIQQEYSARFRDDTQVKTLFTSFSSEEKPEVLNMNVLFNSEQNKSQNVQCRKKRSNLQGQYFVHYMQAKQSRGGQRKKGCKLLPASQSSPFSGLEVQLIMISYSIISYVSRSK